MAKLKKWHVLKEHEGRVTIETECKHVVLTNALSQEELAEIAKNPSAVVFLELVPESAPNDGK